MVELLVVLVLMGLLFTVSGLALASLSSPRQSAWVRALEGGHARAIRSGVPVVVWGDSGTPGSSDSLPSAVLFLPDGRALGSGVDPFTGAPHVAR